MLHTYYLTILLKIVLPVSLLALLCLSSLPEQRVESDEAHLTLSTSLILAIVAYQFVVNSILPSLPYLTSLDYYIYCLFICAAFSVLSNVTLHIEYFNKKVKIQRLFMQISNITSISFFILGHALLFYAYIDVY